MDALCLLQINTMHKNIPMITTVSKVQGNKPLEDDGG